MKKCPFYEERFDTDGSPLGNSCDIGGLGSSCVSKAKFGPKCLPRVKRELSACHEKMNEYYEANYRAREAVRGDNREMWFGTPQMIGAEEGTPERDPEHLRAIIMGLPT